MQKNPPSLIHIIGGGIALILGITSLGFDAYPQFPSMCMILGIIFWILIDTLEPIPPAQTYHWHQIYDGMRRHSIPLWRGLLFMQSKIVFPTLFTIYLILLILQKITIVPPNWQSYATATIDTLHLLWVTLVSAVLANFTGLDEKIYTITRDSKIKNILTLLFVCLLSYGGMWAVFAEIASIGRVAYFVSLGVGILIALVSMMILTEEDLLSANTERVD